MKTAEIKLNDFEAFDRFIFGSEEHNWNKFYDKETNTFTPPIKTPVTEVEHQIDHYALWMVISHFKLVYKPEIFSDDDPSSSKCYACKYTKLINPASQPSCLYCPILNGKINSCSESYNEWLTAKMLVVINRDDDYEFLANCAAQVSRTPWRIIEKE